MRLRLLYRQSAVALVSHASVLILLLLTSYTAWADTGRMRITVTDAVNQRPVATSAIKINSREGDSYELTTDEEGRAQLNGVEEGLYEIIVDHNNYQALRLPSVRVLAAKATPVQIKLTPLRGNLEDIVVTGVLTNRQVINTASTSYIDREALRSAAGSGGDVLRALDGLPGLFSEGEYSSFTVRGNGPRDNLILVDGIAFDNIVHFSDSFGEQEEVEGGGRYSVFAPNIIAGATFQPGGWNSAYGGRAGSLLKLDVAEGNPETPSYNARVDIAGIELGYDGPSRVDDDTAILFSARAYDFGRLFELIGLDDVGTPELTDVIFKSATQVSENDKVNFLVIYAPESFSRDLNNVLASDEDEPGNYDDVELTRAETDNTLLAATWSRLIGEDGELINQIYHRKYDETSRRGEAYPDLMPEGTPASEIPVRENILDSRRTEKELAWQLDFHQDNRLGRLSTGLRANQLDMLFELTLNEDWIQYTYDQNDFRADPDQKYIVLTPQAVNNRYQQKERNYAAYLDQEVLLNNWSFRAGARYDRDNFSEENLISPRFGASWETGSTLRIAAALGRYYQAPRFNDRASDKGNSGLENEIIDQFSIGLTYRLTDDIELFLEPYYQRLDNLVVKQDDVNKTLTNLGEGKSYGFDMAATRQFEGGWSAHINYSYNNAQVKDYPESDYYDADFHRPHSVSIGSVWEINQRWKLSARWKWASGKPKDSYVIHDNVLGDGQPLRYSREITELNNERYGGFNSLNVRADYIRTFGRTNVIAFVDVINILGSENPGSSEFNERTGLNLVEDGEALPLFGLRFEW